MEILSVTLKNFKSHSDRHFIFQPGTNAICGENGAGKTSILEAIAWVLFDYAGDYNKEDLIRNGAASAQVRVGFVSNRDGRTYEVQRCTTKSYTLFDPQLNERLPYNLIKEEVLPWLRQHLGVSPGTDLSQLFSSTIGVPQGTFTADFLITREKRKQIFDKILKVEEYQQTWKKLSDLEKFARVQVEDLEKEIARYEEALQELNDLQQRQEQQHRETEQVRTELRQAQTQLAELQQEQDALVALATRSQQLEAQWEQLSAQIQTQTRNLERFQGALNQAAAAVNICTANRDAHQTFQQAEARLRELEQQRRIEQTLHQQKRQQEKHLSDRQTDRARLMLQLNRMVEARQEVERLAPLAERQAELEHKQQILSQQLQGFHSLHQTAKEQEKRQVQLQTRWAQLSQEIKNLQQLEPSIQEIPLLEQQQQRYQQQLSRIAAAGDFEADLRQILDQSQEEGDRFLDQTHRAQATLQELQQSVPLWREALEFTLTTLESGAACHHRLTAAIESIVQDLSEQTSPLKLNHRLQTLEATLKTTRQQQAQFANLERLQADQTQLEQELTELQARLTSLHSQLAEESTIQAQYAEISTHLAALDNPKARIQLRREELQQESTVQTQLATLQASLQEVEQAIAHLDQHLAEFASLSEETLTQQKLRDAHREAYETYMANREMANSRKQQLQLVEEATAELQALEQQRNAVADERDRLRFSFDPVHFQSVQAAYQTANAQQIALSARLPDMLKLLKELDQQLTRLEITRQKRTETLIKLEQKKRTERFIRFARKAYKEAGPRITERYIHTISHEADKLFRDLLSRPNVSLQWTRDYEILIQESAHSRRFINLSGGEQMCAALAVRLALLKVLADIDIAFFDEPTTNMDRLRREQLAEAIANIKNFRQLFVISHDDTFEKVTENVILVEREV